MQYITLVGDVHGLFNQFLDISESHKNKIIQLGDLGIGFGKNPILPKEISFIHGNHDNPEECKVYSNFLGRFGYASTTEIFHVSGAESIDKNYRTPGMSW